MPILILMIMFLLYLGSYELALSFIFEDNTICFLPISLRKEKGNTKSTHHGIEKGCKIEILL